MEVYSFHFRCVSNIQSLHVCVHALTVCLSIDGAFIEAHDVLSESSSLVTEDVFNLKATI